MSTTVSPKIYTADELSNLGSQAAFWLMMISADAGVAAVWPVEEETLTIYPAGHVLYWVNQYGKGDDKYVIAGLYTSAAPVRRTDEGWTITPFSLDVSKAIPLPSSADVLVFDVPPSNDSEIVEWLRRNYRPSRL